jgi:hypothetical protein
MKDKIDELATVHKLSVDSRKPTIQLGGKYGTIF